jgi:large subunit ribosomal protein L4
MVLEVKAISDKDSVGAVAVSEAVFDQPFNEALVHQLVTKYLAGARAGTKAQKNRSAVSGGGAKPWRQKGNGKARAGTSRSPLWRKGGVTFAAQPRNHDQKLNKKMFKIAVKSIFSELLRQDRLVVSNDIIPTSPKTKELVAKLGDVDANRIMIVSHEINENLELASRNIPNLFIILYN